MESIHEHPKLVLMLYQHAHLPPAKLATAAGSMHDWACRGAACPHELSARATERSVSLLSHSSGVSTCMCSSVYLQGLDLHLLDFLLEGRAEAARI